MISFLTAPSSRRPRASGTSSVPVCAACPLLLPCRLRDQPLLKQPFQRRASLQHLWHPRRLKVVVPVLLPEKVPKMAHLPPALAAQAPLLPSVPAPEVPQRKLQQGLLRQKLQQELQGQQRVLQRRLQRVLQQGLRRLQLLQQQWLPGRTLVPLPLPPQQPQIRPAQLMRACPPQALLQPRLVAQPRQEPVPPALAPVERRV
mmetsp:Transcript_85493/g.169660  ORF Transcript_85493/g.169660 Transcript_85493/m.169660 type:complete len:202 (+) Transcript_85493:1139-1744(+)